MRELGKEAVAGKAHFLAPFFCINSLRSLHITFLRLIYMYSCRLDSPKVEFTWLLSLKRNNVFCMKTRSLLKQTVNCQLIPIHEPVRRSFLGSRPRVFPPTDWACHRQSSKRLSQAEGSPAYQSYPGRANFSFRYNPSEPFTHEAKSWLR